MMEKLPQHGKIICTRISTRYKQQTPLNSRHLHLFLQVSLNLMTINFIIVSAVVYSFSLYTYHRKLLKVEYYLILN